MTTPIEGVRYFLSAAGTWQTSVDGSLSPATSAGSLPVGQAVYPIPTPTETHYVRYVSTTSGSDSNNGTTINTPYKTLLAALNKLQTPLGGQPERCTIVLRGGEYHDVGAASEPFGSTIASNRLNITVQNYPGETVWFDGSEKIPDANWQAAGATWKAPCTTNFNRSPTTDRVADDGNDPGWQWVDSTHPMAPAPEMLFVDNEQYTQVDSLTKVIGKTFFVEGAYQNGSRSTPPPLGAKDRWVWQATNIYIGTSPIGRDVRYAARKAGIGLQGANATVRGIGVRRYANSLADRAAVHVGASGCTLENVWVEDIATTAVSLAQDVEISNLTCRNVTIKRAGNLGIRVYRADNVMIDSCYLEDCNYEQFNYAPRLVALSLAAGAVAQLFETRRSAKRKAGSAFGSTSRVTTWMCITTTSKATACTESCTRFAPPDAS